MTDWGLNFGELNFGTINGVPEVYLPVYGEEMTQFDQVQITSLSADLGGVSEVICAPAVDNTITVLGDQSCVEECRGSLTRCC